MAMQSLYLPYECAEIDKSRQYVSLPLAHYHIYMSTAVCKYHYADQCIYAV